MSDYNTPSYERAENGTAPGDVPPPRQPRSKWWAFAIAVGLIVVCAVIAGVGLFGGIEDTSVPFSSGSKNVEIIDISGTIETAGTTYNQSWINERITTAKNDSDNVAIMLLINSPGGAVYESDETYLKLLDYKKETGRPVYAYCESMAASGGYYIAAAADKIVANRNSLVGSIGVIGGQFVDGTSLLEKLGLKITTVHSGANKLMGSLYEPATEEQLAIMQSISDEYYNQFVGIVADSRGMSTDAVKALADGRVYSASQAKANGLIDEIQTMDDFDAMLKEELGDDVVFYHETYKQDTLDALFSSASQLIGKRQAASSELASTLDALEGLSVSEPMYLYQP